jgi:hypothetical protein
MDEPGLRQLRAPGGADLIMRIVPVTLKQARAFVLEHHRHSGRPPGGNWAIGLMDGEQLVGVAIAGRPVSQVLQRRGYLEVTRVCVLEGFPRACSQLYGACRRIGQAMGYSRFVSYTLEVESGASLRASGFAQTAEVRAKQWGSKSRARPERQLQRRLRWES